MAKVGDVGACELLKLFRSDRSLVPPRVLKAKVRGVIGLRPRWNPGVSGLGYTVSVRESSTDSNFAQRSFLRRFFSAYWAF